MKDKPFKQLRIYELEGNVMQLVRYVRALRALQKSLREHGMDVSSTENNAVWNEVIEAYEALGKDLRDRIKEDTND